MLDERLQGHPPFDGQVGCAGDNHSWLSFPLEQCIPDLTSGTRSRRFISRSCAASDATGYDLSYFETLECP